MRPSVHAALGALALALALPTPAAADESVIGGKPAPLSHSPWAVALASMSASGPSAPDSSAAACSSGTRRW